MLPPFPFKTNRSRRGILLYTVLSNKESIQKCFTHRFADIRQGEPERKHDGEDNEERDLLAGVGRPGQAERLVILVVTRFCGLLWREREKHIKLNR